MYNAVDSLDEAISSYITKLTRGASTARGQAGRWKSSPLPSLSTYLDIIDKPDERATKKIKRAFQFSPEVRKNYRRVHKPDHESGGSRSGSSCPGRCPAKPASCLPRRRAAPI